MFNKVALVEEVEIEGSKVKAIEEARYLRKLISGSVDLMPEIIRSRVDWVWKMYEEYEISIRF